MGTHLDPEGRHSAFLPAYPWNRDITKSVTARYVASTVACNKRSREIFWSVFTGLCTVSFHVGRSSIL